MGRMFGDEPMAGVFHADPLCRAERMAVNRYERGLAVMKWIISLSIAIGGMTISVFLGNTVGHSFSDHDTGQAATLIVSFVGGIISGRGAVLSWLIMDMRGH